MLSYIEYLIKNLGVPTSIALILVVLFFIIQMIGELLEFKGKVVPEIMKVRKYFRRKQEEHDAIRQMPEVLQEHRQMMIDNKQIMEDYKRLAEDNKCLVDVNNKMITTIEESNNLMKEISSHYSTDNIAMRDGWMREVNEHIAESENRRREQALLMKELKDKLDKNNADTLSILIDNKRNYLLDFTSKAVDMSYPLSKEQYQRFYNVHREYEDILAKNGMTNGQVDVAYDVATKSFEERLKKHAFIEDNVYSS